MSTKELTCYYEQVSEDFIEKYAQAVYQRELGEISEEVIDINLMVASRAFPDEELLKEASAMGFIGGLVGRAAPAAAKATGAAAQAAPAVAKPLGFFKKRLVQFRGGRAGLTPEQTAGIIGRMETKAGATGKGALKRTGFKGPSGETARYVSGVKKAPATPGAPTAPGAPTPSGVWGGLSNWQKAGVVGGTAAAGTGLVGGGYLLGSK